MPVALLRDRLAVRFPNPAYWLKLRRGKERPERGDPAARAAFPCSFRSFMRSECRPMKQLSFLCVAVFGVAMAFGAAAEPTRADEEAVRTTIREWFAAFSGGDEAQFRSLMIADWLLCENGEVLDLAGAITMFKQERPPGYQRTDQFDFKSVTVRGDIAWAVYFLESDISSDEMQRHRKWLESVVVRKVDGRWRAALHHSTKIAGTDTPRG